MSQGDAERTCDLMVIGAGPAGYTAALRGARLGLDVICVDHRDEPGGVCLNAGCIPSKALISVAELATRVRRNRMGLSGGADLQVDLPTLRAWKEKVVDGMVRGIRLLLRRSGVRYLPVRARLTGPDTALLEGEEGGPVRFRHALVAVGSRPIELPGIPTDGHRILSSRDLLRLDRLPSPLLVLGGGYIGMELAFAARGLGCEVAVVEMMDQMLPGIEEDLTKLVVRAYRRLGIRTLPGRRATGVEASDSGVVLRAGGSRGDVVLEGEACLMALGRRPDAIGLGLETAGLEPDAEGFIPVDAALRTRVPSILAAGDITGQPLLAHKGYFQGKRAAETAAGQEPTEMGPVPAVLFTHPEIATVGWTAEEARRQGREVRIGQQRFVGLGRAQAHGETDGFVRLVADQDSGVILGAQMVGPSVTDLISEAALAVRNRLTLDQVHATVHPHPTFGEAFLEAAEAAADISVHHLP